VPIAFASLPSVLGYLKAGRLAALGVSPPKRSPALPEVPANAKKLPGYAGTMWIGLFTPRGVPAEIDAKQAMTQVLADPATRSALTCSRTCRTEIMPPALKAERILNGSCPEAASRRIGS
jgi:tripartite-type tricarboxylate transporter receptor subunit TctC